MIKRVDVPVRVNAMSVGGWLSADDGAKDRPSPASAAGLTESPLAEDDEIDHEARQELAVPARELSQRLEEYQDKVGVPAPETKQT